MINLLQHVIFSIFLLPIVVAADAGLFTQTQFYITLSSERNDFKEKYDLRNPVRLILVFSVCVFLPSLFQRYINAFLDAGMIVSGVGLVLFTIADAMTYADGPEE
jgi:hypothetical protein